MIEVSVEGGSETARLGVVVRAESIRRAVDIVMDYYPGNDARVRHPIDPESFFVQDPTKQAGVVEFEMPQSMAG